MTKDLTKTTDANDREWKRGVLMIACITCVPVAIAAVARVLVG